MRHEIHHRDCINLLTNMMLVETEDVECIFADPPDNINLGYGEYKDKMPDSEYVQLLKDWVDCFVDTAWTTWISFNAKWTLDMGVIAKMVMDSHPEVKVKPCVQVFTFGQHNKYDFGNNHRPLWRFQWPEGTTYPEQIKVPSWRQLNGDKRAKAGGRVPGDVAKFERFTLPLPSLSTSDIERLLSKIERGGDDDCWEWNGCKRGGYGRIRIGGRSGNLYGVTRLMWRLTHGTDPIGQLLCHTCDNPSCCNPKHLFLGTDYDNNQDKEKKSRGAHPKGEDNELAKLSERDVVEIFSKPGSLESIGREFGVTGACVKSIKTGKTWSHVTRDLPLSDVFDFPRVTGNSKQRRSWHPTQLHEDLVERCIKSCTIEGDLVIDPFAGTGTTLRVCKRLDRACVTMDMDRSYCEKIAEEHNLEVKYA